MWSDNEWPVSDISDYSSIGGLQLSWLGERDTDAWVVSMCRFQSRPYRRLFTAVPFSFYSFSRCHYIVTSKTSTMMLIFIERASSSLSSPFYSYSLGNFSKLDMNLWTITVWIFFQYVLLRKIGMSCKLVYLSVVIFFVVVFSLSNWKSMW